MATAKIVYTKGSELEPYSLSRPPRGQSKESTYQRSISSVGDSSAGYNTDHRSIFSEDNNLSLVKSTFKSTFQRPDQTKSTCLDAAEDAAGTVGLTFLDSVIPPSNQTTGRPNCSQ